MLRFRLAFPLHTGALGRYSPFVSIQQDSAAGDSAASPSRRRRRFLRAGLVILVLPVLLWFIENWRGRHAWEQCKREFAAKGEVLDWSAYVPAPVPDAENILKAPRIAEWMARREATDPLPCFNSIRFEAFVNRRHSNVVAEVTVVDAIDPKELKPPDLVLQYACHVVSLAATNETTAKAFDPRFPPNPIIEFRDVPLTIAIENLAREAGLNVVLDPKATDPWRGLNGQIVAPIITRKWQDVTGAQVLFWLLDTYGLILIEDSRTGLARITRLDPGSGSVYVAPEAGERLQELSRGLLRQQLDAISQPQARGNLTYTFVARELSEVRPMRVVVLAEYLPDLKALADFFPRELGPSFPRTKIGWRAEVAGSNSFRIFPDRAPAYAATDYLAWSEQFQPEFDTFREALKRPTLRLEGNYDRPDKIPIPNYFCVRTAVQILGQRAQCHLLLGQSAEALRELALLYELRRFFSGRPVTLVNAMMDVAVTGLYLDALADGLRLRAWREPELLALQQQLAAVDLLPPFQAAIRHERAAVCQSLQVIPAEEFAELFQYPWGQSQRPNGWQVYAAPPYLLMKFGPRGWRYQNLATLARAEQATVEIINPAQSLANPAKAAEASREIERLNLHRSPYTVLASRATPDFVRAASSVARAQTKTHLALLASGLERHRLVHGDFPETLDALLPQFVPRLPRDLIGGQPLHYRRTTDGHFLLYSVGWDEQDDGGKTTIDQNGLEDFTRPDWVWPLK